MHGMGMIRKNKQEKQASSDENKQEKRPVGRGWSFGLLVYILLKHRWCAAVADLQDLIIIDNFGVAVVHDERNEITGEPVFRRCMDGEPVSVGTVGSDGFVVYFNDNGSFRIDVGGHVDLTGNVYKQQGAKHGENKQEFFHGVYLSFGKIKHLFEDIYFFVNSSSKG